MSCTATGLGRSPAGWKILLPGYAHWTWQQRARALVLAGSYLAALAVGLFGWGTTAGFLVLAFAYATHVVSAADVIRQQAFPGFGRCVPMLSTGGALGLGLYGPALWLASLFAWPGMGESQSRDGYLVNCRAYAAAAPRQADWVWLRSPSRGGGRLARVLAGPGQELEWSEGQFRLDGEPLATPADWPSGPWPEELALTVPAEHVLVLPTAPGAGRAVPVPAGPLLVPRSEILGRAWARFYPIHRRQLLR
jgi:hypothetical protein